MIYLFLFLFFFCLFVQLIKCCCLMETWKLGRSEHWWSSQDCLRAPPLVSVHTWMDEGMKFCDISVKLVPICTSLGSVHSWIQHLPCIWIYWYYLYLHKMICPSTCISTEWMYWCLVNTSGICNSSSFVSYGETQKAYCSYLLNMFYTLSPLY